MTEDDVTGIHTHHPNRKKRAIKELEWLDRALVKEDRHGHSWDQLATPENNFGGVIDVTKGSVREARRHQ